MEYIYHPFYREGKTTTFWNLKQEVKLCPTNQIIQRLVVGEDHFHMLSK